MFDGRGKGILTRDFSVALRVLSETLTPDDVSSRVGLAPTYVRAAGSGKADDRRHVWEFEPPFSAAQDDFPGRLEELLDGLSWVEEGLVSLGTEAELVLWGACFSSAPETTVHIPPALMRQLAGLGIAVYVSVYVAESDE